MARPLFSSLFISPVLVLVSFFYWWHVFTRRLADTHLLSVLGWDPSGFIAGLVDVLGFG